jgi:tetratricopeptide (TPR) repeat protein
MEAARKSFSFVDLKDPRYLGFPAQLALSMGTLAIQSALRGLVTFEVVGPARYGKMMTDFFEMFTEVHVFIGLEYRELMDKYRVRLKAHPDDHSTRVELGRTLIKCGLYDDAARELELVPEESSHYATAMHDAAVALNRGGRYLHSAEIAVKAIEAAPDNERAISWLWVTAQKLGGYPAFVPASCRMEMRAGQEKPTVEFEDIASKIGLDKTSAGRGIAVFDYDNDGYLDILIAAAHGGCNLYHNNGDGTFTDVSIASGLDNAVNTFAITVADYNNDGFEDIYITRLGFYVGEGQLFRNNGDGTFTDVTKEAGLKMWGPSFTASWVDYDGDGFVDLFIANNLGGIFERKTPNRLFHNNGDGTFTEVTDQAGLQTVWPTIGGAWGDYDNDGHPDLFLSNGLGRSQLYHNNGDGTFTDVSEKAGVTELGFGSPAFWWDYDNDGWMDIGQFEWSDHEDVVYTMRHNEGPPEGRPFRCYHNNRDGTFTKVSREIGLNGSWGTMSGNCGDFNNDGYLDLVLGNGSPRMDRLEPMIVMENDGKKFHNITFAAGFPYTGKSHGVTLADLFGDGRLSILVASGGAYPGDLLTTGVFYPKTLPGNYVNVRLVGTKSNRSAIGARITLEAGGMKQTREVSGGSNFGCLPLEQHFGLAAHTKVDTIIIRWPSQQIQRFDNLEMNKTYEFTEGQDGWTDVYAEAKKKKLQGTAEESEKPPATHRRKRKAHEE